MLSTSVGAPVTLRLPSSCELIGWQPNSGTMSPHEEGEGLMLQALWHVKHIRSSSFCLESRGPSEVTVFHPSDGLVQSFKFQRERIKIVHYKFSDHYFPQSAKSSLVFFWFSEQQNFSNTSTKQIIVKDSLPLNQESANKQTVKVRQKDIHNYCLCFLLVYDIVEPRGASVEQTETFRFEFMYLLQSNI